MFYRKPVLHCKFLFKIFLYLNEEFIAVCLSFGSFPKLKAKERKENHGKKVAEYSYGCFSWLYIRWGGNVWMVLGKNRVWQKYSENYEGWINILEELEKEKKMQSEGKSLLRVEIAFLVLDLYRHMFMALSALLSLRTTGTFKTPLYFNTICTVLGLF